SPHSRRNLSAPNMTSSVITGIAVVERPRIIDTSQPRSVWLDAGIYSGNPHQPLIANFRYWNDGGVEFGDGPIVCFIVATMQPHARVNSSVLSATDYDIVGDILQLIPAPGADPAHSPFIFACGQATNIQNNISMFDVLPTQYVSQLPLRQPSNFPMRVEIPSSKRYESRGKPMPKNTDSRFHVQGFLKDVTRGADEVVQWFNVRLHNIVYFDRLPVPPIHSE
ncbi:uncharacterized protein C8Q71DRAFT_710346, partial [Rhodofomes roseus]